MKENNSETGFYSVEEMRRFFGISQKVAYRLIHTPGFPVVKLGGTYRIPKREVQVWWQKEARKQTGFNSFLPMG